MRHLFPIVLFIIALTSGATAAPLANQLFGDEQTGSPHRSEPFGNYSKGCLAGGQQLPETGPTWQAMRLSRNRNWGHKNAIDFIEDLSRYAATQPGWKGLYIGDISQPRGGPMTSGHRSHQVGLDIDIWMLPATNLNLSRKSRETLSSISVTTRNQTATNSNWTRAHFNILKKAAEDKRVERILVSPGIKVQMCKEAKGNKRWLSKIRLVGAHNYHFHVRLACPKGARGCVPQTPPPNRDECDVAQRVVNDMLNPPPPKPRDPNAPPPKVRRHPRSFTMADLPQACGIVLNP